MVEAKVFCQVKRTEITNRGTETLNLPEHVRKDAMEASKVLDGTGVTILEAARDYMRRNPKTIGETVSATCERYLANMQDNDRRELSIAEKCLKFKSLSKALGEIATAAVDETDITLVVPQQARRACRHPQSA